MKPLSHIEIAEQIYAYVCDKDCPFEVNAMGDVYIIKFNYGGAYHKLSHTKCGGWTLKVDYDYIDLGYAIGCIRVYPNGKLIILGDLDVYVFDPGMGVC